MGRGQRHTDSAVVTDNGDPMNAPRVERARPLGQRANLSAAFAQGLLPEGCQRFFEDHREAFLLAPGSGHNHQYWSGGYADHVDELFAIAATTHEALSRLRPMPFALADALLVLYLHDVEKIFKRLPEGVSVPERYAAIAQTDQHGLQDLVCRDYGIELSDEQRNALAYVHGEGEDYRKDKRVAGPLAAFCHDCDYWSARGWHDEPQRSGPLPNLLGR